MTIRVRAVFNSRGQLLTLSTAITNHANWRQYAGPEWDLYPYDLTVLPSAEWPDDERDPFQNPAIVRQLARTYLPGGSRGSAS